MTTAPNAADSRTLVDRTLDRIKNNRAAAALIVAALALGALATLSDTIRRLGDAVPPTRVALDGVWRTTAPVDVFSGAGPTTLVLTLRDAAASRVTGTVRLFDSTGGAVTRALDIEGGRRDGNTARFVVYGGWMRNTPDGRVVPLPEQFDLELAAGELRGVYEREGSGSASFTARRTGPAAP